MRTPCEFVTRRQHVQRRTKTKPSQTRPATERCLCVGRSEGAGQRERQSRYALLTQQRDDVKVNP